MFDDENENSTGKGPETTHSNTVDTVDTVDTVVGEKEGTRKRCTFGPNSYKVVKPTAILIDIYGVICSWEFAKNLKIYAKKNMANYLAENWHDKTFKLTLGLVREQIAIDKYAGVDIPEIAPVSASDEQQLTTTTASILWQMEQKHNTTRGLIDRLCGDLWAKSYQSGRLKTHAYPDVAETFRYWRFEEFVKIYSFSSGGKEGQMQFLRCSQVGDLTHYVVNCLSSRGAYKNQTEMFQWTAIALRESNLQNILYISHCQEKAKSAIKAGLRTLVVNRDNKYSSEEIQDIAVVRSLLEIQFVGLTNLVIPK